MNDETNILKNIENYGKNPFIYLLLDVPKKSLINFFGASFEAAILLGTLKVPMTFSLQF